MKKVIDWLYWEGNKWFCVLSMFLGLSTLISFGIDRNSKVGTVIAITWIVSGMIMLIFDRIYENYFNKTIDNDNEM